MLPDGSSGPRFGCERCWPPAAAAAWEARGTLTHVADLIDDSHFHVMILACPHCAQRFVSVFTETIDWQGGDDPQDWALLPLSAEEAAEPAGQGASLSEARLNALAPDRRSLQRRCPNPEPERTFWGTGRFVGWHD